MEENNALCSDLQWSHWCQNVSDTAFFLPVTCVHTYISLYFCLPPVCAVDVLNKVWCCVDCRKEDQIQLLETEMDQERQMADSLVNDMVTQTHCYLEVNNNDNNNNNNKKSYLYSAIRHYQYPYSAVCSHIEQKMQYVRVWKCMRQSYSYTYTCLHINTYTNTCIYLYMCRCM